MNNTVLVTGCAGFIGFHVTNRLLSMGFDVVGLDNMNAYYDPALKYARLQLLQEQQHFRMHTIDLAHKEGVEEVFLQEKPQYVIHLAAQAGVRYSLQQPHAYIDANVSGLLNVLEGCRRHDVKHLIYASSSSVYGANTKVPFHENDSVDHPVSLYAATKKAGELMAHTYSHLYNLPTTGLRFFTVYGPWGRPDMAYFSFTDAIVKGKPIDIYNHGNMSRDFTYIDDVVEGVVRLLDRPPVHQPEWDASNPMPSTSAAPYRIYNIGNHQPQPLLRLIDIIEELLGVKAKKNMKPMQPGDVQSTYADVSALMRDVGYHPSTPLEEGLQHFINWYRSYYGISN